MSFDCRGRYNKSINASERRKMMEVRRHSTRDRIIKHKNHKKSEVGWAVVVPHTLVTMRRGHLYSLSHGSTTCEPHQPQTPNSISNSTKHSHEKFQVEWKSSQELVESSKSPHRSRSLNQADIPIIILEAASSIMSFDQSGSSSRHSSRNRHVNRLK